MLKQAWTDGLVLAVAALAFVCMEVVAWIRKPRP